MDWDPEDFNEELLDGRVVGLEANWDPNDFDEDLLEDRVAAVEVNLPQVAPLRLPRLEWIDMLVNAQKNQLIILDGRGEPIQTSLHRCAQAVRKAIGSITVPGETWHVYAEQERAREKVGESAAGDGGGG